MPYSATDYLLDRANIHDTISRLYMHVDLRNWSGLQAECPAPKFLLDYTALFGGEPRSITPADLVDTWRPLMESMSSTQHIVTQLVITLPQPSETAEPATTATAFANVFVHLNKKPDAARGEGRMSNGGRYDIEMTKLQGEAGNPWRISVLKATPLWMDGDEWVLKT